MLVPPHAGLQAGDVHSKVRAEPFASSEECELDVFEKFENIREVNEVKMQQGWSTLKHFGVQTVPEGCAVHEDPQGTGTD